MGMDINHITAPAWWDAAVAETSVTVGTNTGCLEKLVFACLAGIIHPAALLPGTRGILSVD